MAVESLSISKLPERTQLLLFALITLSFCYVSISWWIKPIQSEVEELQEDISTLSSEKLRGEVEKGRLPVLKEEVRQSEKKLSKLREILPEQKETADIIRKIQRLAVESNLKIKSFIPRKTIRNDFYEDWPIVISMEGTYDNLGIFFERVGQFARIINVDNITIKGLQNPGSRRTITATCTATTFVFREDTPT